MSDMFYALCTMSYPPKKPSPTANFSNFKKESLLTTPLIFYHFPHYCDHSLILLVRWSVHSCALCIRIVKTLSITNKTSGSQGCVVQKWRLGNASPGQATHFQIIVLLIIVKERGSPSRRQAFPILKDIDRGGKERLLFSKHLFRPISNSLTKRPMNWKSDEIAKRKEAGDHLQISRTFLIDYLNSFPLPIHTHNLITIQEDNQETSTTNWRPWLQISSRDITNIWDLEFQLLILLDCLVLL